MELSINTLATEQATHILDADMSADQLTWYRDTLPRQDIQKLIACSPACARLIARYPHWLPEILENYADDLDDEFWKRSLASTLEAISDQEELEQALREYRNFHWLRIVWRDLNRFADTRQTTRELSLMAEACIDLALDWLHRRYQPKWGTPCDAQGKPQQLVVLAMGKLGARELNLSSDIDLIFSYPEGGTTRDGRREMDNQEYFIRLGQQLIKALDQQTADGFVFRVDMRLRPHGQSGPLVISFDAMEDYYQTQGREWERYAMIKARAVSGELKESKRLLNMLRPFVYRSYTDFSVIDALRGMKALIVREMERRKLHNDLKLGPGGIREIEFIAQCFQLIRGGQEPDLQRRNLSGVMQVLKESEALPARVVDELLAAYAFLRDSEHAVQAWEDRQTQKLPSEADEQLAIAAAMGFADWSAYFKVLEGHRLRVAAHFAEVIADPEHEATVSTVSEWSRSLDEPTEASLLQAFDEAHFAQAEESAKRFGQFLNSTAVARMQLESRDRLDQFLPCLMEAICQTEAMDLALERTLPLVEAVLRRTAYLSLLIENPDALQRLVNLCAESPWIARELALHPVLLDELQDAHTLFHPADKAELQSELYQHLLRVTEDDLEGQMNALRYFKLSHCLRVAAAEINGTLPLMKVSDYLSNIAEAVCQQVLDLAWQQMVLKYGQPASDDAARKPFIIIGYGKLGGLELSHGSDLDLVFIHDIKSGGFTDGTKAVDNSMFVLRLGQRIIHLLNTRTRLGQLYEVDMRLRPNGESGLLVSSMEAFDKYQCEQAWVWEHQALVRARVIAGDEQLAAAFSECRAGILQQARENPELRDEVVKMREKMRQHLRPKDTETEENPEFDLKHGGGAIVDIEFMVQYAVLIWSRQHPSLSRFTDNIRILESLCEAGLLSENDSNALIEAYKALRSYGHRLVLQQQKARLHLTVLTEERQQVQQLWQQLMLD